MTDTGTTVIVGVATVLGVILFAVAAFHVVHVDRRIRARGFLYMTASGGIQLAAAVVADSSVPASVHAVVVAVGLYGWWNNGGGDGLRRAWRKLQSRIPSRLAPQFA